ncbi:hypothetical protein CORT_0D05550 [Candida orthopsilosis Co 90-125]|uniref:Essential protein Yae1 N-terminal domain-containing protein n=1 Tax=Candida orthopsilosis (strain 90-125) TaxID=1136231 RepID=H8X5D8_CANO9|nr:hypothetical protein CORT_0D05550 [Candida orthopsilosis Co 90-125]CCG23394.1 hypothetical protein CORT_0D05550 [Candida orthopsilosis Co 90-125]
MSVEDIDIDIDTDEVLNLEQEQYQIGYQEGVEESAKQQYLEGKQFGYQTGFQRFLIVGYIKGLIEEWEGHIDNYSDSKSVLSNHLQQLKSYVDNISVNNDETSVAQFELQLKKARNKLRVICQLVKESWKINNLDTLVEQVVGSMQVSENVDEMW